MRRVRLSAPRPLISASLIARHDIDAVDVCLHNTLHAPVTIAALEAGKHVYCEKPMAASWRDADAMLAAARQTGRKLSVQLSTLYAPETKAARVLIREGRLGKIYHARSAGFRRRGRPYVDGYGSPSFVKKSISAGGAMYDMGVYHLAQVMFLLGNPPVETISGKTYQEIGMNESRRAASGYDVEELGLGFVRLAGNVSLDIIESWAIMLDSLQGSVILGSEGGVRLQPFGYFHTRTVTWTWTTPRTSMPSCTGSTTSRGSATSTTARSSTGRPHSRDGWSFSPPRSLPCRRC